VDDWIAFSAGASKAATHAPQDWIAFSLRSKAATHAPQDWIAFSLRSKAARMGELNKESHPPRWRAALPFSSVRMLKRAWHAPKEKSHRLCRWLSL